MSRGAWRSTAFRRSWRTIAPSARSTSSCSRTSARSCTRPATAWPASTFARARGRATSRRCPRVAGRSGAGEDARPRRSLIDAAHRDRPRRPLPEALSRAAVRPELAVDARRDDDAAERHRDLQTRAGVADAGAFVDVAAPSPEGLELAVEARVECEAAGAEARAGGPDQRRRRAVA